jgi:hypothetical protein
LESRAEAGELFKKSASAADARINVFLVNDFSGELGDAAGIAGGVPVPMDVNGTIHSGVAVAIQSTASKTGDAMAHEMGHSLGLYHSSNYDGTSDPIGDTPACASGTINSTPNSCPDASNIMFPRLNGMYAVFSGGQAKVLRPALHVRRVEGAVSSIHELPIETVATGADVEPGFVAACVLKQEPRSIRWNRSNHP